jgi:hypothetical protein
MCNSVESSPVGPYSLARSNRQNRFEIAGFRHPWVWLETCDGLGCVKGRKINRSTRYRVVKVESAESVASLRLGLAPTQSKHGIA